MSDSIIAYEIRCFYSILLNFVIDNKKLMMIIFFAVPYNFLYCITCGGVILEANSFFIKEL